MKAGSRKNEAGSLKVEIVTHEVKRMINVSGGQKMLVLIS